MSDTPEALGEKPGTVVILRDHEPPTDGVSSVASLVTESGDVLQVVEERLTVGRWRLPTGSVRIGTHTETVDAVAEVELDRYRVEVTRVPVGCVVDEAPQARAEGDTTIVPVIEERLVVVKQFFLVEEVHIRHVLERQTVAETVTLRRQRAVIEHLDPQGRSEPGLAIDTGLQTKEGTSNDRSLEGANASTPSQRP